MSNVLTQDQVDELFEQWLAEDDARILGQLERRLAWVRTGPVALPDQLKRRAYCLGADPQSP